MRKFLLVLSLAFIHVCSFTQWVNLSTTIPGDLNEVFFIDTNVGLVVGDSGVFKTTNAGISWSKQILTGNTTDSVAFLNTKFNTVFYDNGFWYAAGKDRATSKGVIFKDSLSNWILCYSVTSNGINSVSEVSSNITAVGENGLIIYSGNNGNSWLSGSASGITNDFFYVKAIGNRAYIGGQNILLKKNIGTSVTWYQVSTQTVTHLLPYSSTKFYGVNSTNILEGNQLTTINSNYTGTIQPTCIEWIGFGPNACIGTNNGILRSINDFKYWEKTNSSIGYHINDIEFLGQGDFGYAVGKNGLVLKTRNKGGDALPVILFNSSNGACKDSVVNITNDTVPGYTYSWKINDSCFIPPNNQIIDTAFDSTRTYVVRLIANNGTLIDSLDKTFQVVDLPETNKTMALSDSVLCKVGDSDVIIYNSQLNTRYQFIRLSDHAVLGTAFGNNDSLVFNTGTITDSTFYLINAKSIFADCDIYFPDTILVPVEKTKANFHSVFINANLNEGIKMFNNSQQATYYDWNFGTTSSIPASTNFEETVSYNALGQTQTTLIATSFYGCNDTLTKNGAFIYDETNIRDNCWAFNFGGPLNDNAFDVQVMNSGDVLVCGKQLDYEYETRGGITSQQQDTGFFIAKYTEFGVLKWVVKGIPEGNWASQMTNITIDKNDNIFGVGFTDKPTLYSNDGTINKLDKVLSSSSPGEILIKLDSNGVFQWNTHFSNATPYLLDTDSSGNIYVAGELTYGGATFYSRSGVTASLPQTQKSFYILKMDTAGEIDWVNYLYENSSTYYQDLSGLAVTQSGDIFLTGKHDGQLVFHSTDLSKDTINRAGRRFDIFLAKYNTLGNYKWGHSLTTGSGSYISSDYAYAVAVDKQGNSFVSLEVDDPYGRTHLYFPSVNKADDTVAMGKYGLMSYDSSGDFRWATGVKYSYLGRGTDVTVDDYGNVYTIGYASDYTASTGDYTSTNGFFINLPVLTGGSFFIAKYSNFGQLDWATLESGQTYVNSGSTTYPRAISVDKNQNVYVTGEYRKNSTPGIYIIAKDTLSIQNRDIFLAKFSASGCLQSDSLISIVSSGPYCEGSSIKVPFYAPQSISFVSSNTYTLELSDSSGAFTSPTVIGTLSSILNFDTITGTIPTGVYANKNYRVRVVSTNPSIIGNASFINIGVTSLTPISYTDTFCVGKTANLTPNFGYKYSWSPSSYLQDTLSRIGISTPQNSIQYWVTVDNYCAIVKDTFNLVISAPSRDSISPVSCYQYTLPSGSNVLTASGIYYDTLAASSTCDSIIKISLTINQRTTSSINNTSCFSYLSPGGKIFSASGVYPDTIPNSMGCDSVISISLTINTLNNNVNQIGGINLNSNEIFATYQWLDCNNGYTLIAGETNQTFVATVNGSYAVEIRKNGCIDTSNCITVNSVGLKENEFINRLSISPNPNNGNFSLQLEKEQEITSLFITDINGRLIKEITPQKALNYEISFEGAFGIYFLNVVSANERRTIKLVKE